MLDYNPDRPISKNEDKLNEMRLAKIDQMNFIPQKQNSNQEILLVELRRQKRNYFIEKLRDINSNILYDNDILIKINKEFAAEISTNT